MGDALVWSVLAACVGARAPSEAPAAEATASAPPSTGAGRVDGPKAWSGAYAVVIGWSDDERALDAVVGRVAGRQVDRLDTSWFSSLPPCRVLAVAGGPLPSREAADAVVAALGSPARAVALGAIEVRARVCAPRTDGGEVGVWVVDGERGIGLGPHAPPSDGWSGRPAVPLPDTAEIAGLRVGDRVRVGDEICAVDGFVLHRTCLDHAEVVARLAAGCGRRAIGEGGAGVAVPERAPSPERYARIDGGPTWTGSGGTVTVEGTVPARVTLVPVAAGPARVLVEASPAAGEGIVADVVDVDLDAVPEVVIRDADGTWIAAEGRRIGGYARVVCGPPSEAALLDGEGR